MNIPKISIIVPVYNVENYLDESLQSILNQTFIDEIEVIMVDDGSSDDSRYIIENYALDYDNFYAYHKDNGGAGVARNYGLQFAKGEYIHFMDPDDYINFDAYEKLYSLAIENNADIVVGNANRFDRYKKWDENLFKNSFKDFEGDLLINNINERLSLLWDTVLWNKIFKREFILNNNIFFPDNDCIYEDIPFTLKSYILAKTIFITSEVMYFWRLRKKSTSSTQQYENIKTFYDRIKMLGICDDLMNKLNVNDDLRNYEYQKWLNHDLKLFLKRLIKFSEEYYSDIVFYTNCFINKIPACLRDNLNSYKKIIYKMVENNDLESLVNFSNLENQLMKDPCIPDNLDEKYHKYIDFIEDGISEELTVEKLDVITEDKFLIISFKERINYIPHDYLHEIEAYLCDNYNTNTLDVEGGKIKIPISLINNKKSRMFIKVRYISDKINKDSFLKSHKRQIIRFDNYDVECGIGRNRLFCLNVRKTNDVIVEVEKIIFKDNKFEFTAKSNSTLKNIILENVIDFKKIEYPVKNINDKMYFTIPYEDICKNAIRKWEIKSDNNFDTIKLNHKFSFYKNSNKITFLNARNKILIEEDIYNKFNELNTLDMNLKYFKSINNDLKNKNKKLRNENEKLIKTNLRLKNRIDEYKSRKIVKLVDKIKNS